MFSYELYKWLHLVGILMLFMAFGGAILRPAPANGEAPVKDLSRKLIAMFHGLGLLLILVAGFGMLARLGMISDLPHWVWMKVGIWLALGGGIALALRRKLPLGILAAGALALGAAAAALALWK
jgi:hypothetical protein